MLSQAKLRVLPVMLAAVFRLMAVTVATPVQVSAGVADPAQVILPENSASGSTGGSAPANGFAGAWGLTASGTGADADRKAGAGGSGGYKPAGNSTRNGGRGGNGQIRITYTSAFKNYCPKILTV